MGFGFRFAARVRLRLRLGELEEGEGLIGLFVCDVWFGSEWEMMMQSE